MRVIEVIKGLNVGGAEMLLLSRLATQTSIDYRLLVCGGDSSRNLLAEFLSEGIQPTFISGRFALLKFPCALLKATLDFEADIVHVHSPSLSAISRVIVKIMPRRVRPSHISTVHSVSFTHPITRVASRMTVRLDDFTIAVSGAVAASPHCRHARRCITVLHEFPIRYSSKEHLPVDVSSFMEGASHRICTIANVRAEKDFALFITSAQLILERLPDTKFVVFGGGPLLDFYRLRVQELGLQKDVYFAGVVQLAGSYLNHFQMFLLTSRIEGRPVAVLEAIAAGIPIVATDAGGVRDMLAGVGNSTVVTDRKPYAICSAVVDALCASEREDRSLASSNKDAKSLTTSMRQIEEIFAGSLSRRRAPACLTEPTDPDV